MRILESDVQDGAEAMLPLKRTVFATQTAHTFAEVIQGVGNLHLQTEAICGAASDMGNASLAIPLLNITQKVICAWLPYKPSIGKPSLEKALSSMVKEADGITAATNFPPVFKVPMIDFFMFVEDGYRKMPAPKIDS
jgi:hypothetical protein